MLIWMGESLRDTEGHCLSPKHRVYISPKLCTQGLVKTEHMENNHFLNFSQSQNLLNFSQNHSWLNTLVHSWHPEKFQGALTSVPSSHIPSAWNVHPLLHLLGNFYTSFMGLFRCCPLRESLLDSLADGVPSSLYWAPMTLLWSFSQKSVLSPT